MGVLQMNEQVMQIARRIKELREILEISTDDLAKTLSISTDKYSDYEDGKRDIPIGVLYGIAARLNVDPTVLMTGDTPRMADYTIVRDGNGVKVERYKGYDFTALAFNYISRDMEPMIVHLEADDEEPVLVCHAGQEFNYVLEGTITITLGGHKFSLSAGDSIYFDPKILHGQKAKTRNAKFLTVINE
jgi:transcriptional regulator with XRE-family HTH domain